MTFEERMKHFPKDGKNQIATVLAKAHKGKSPLKPRTIGDILRGERTDNHGVFDIFISITDEIKNAKEQAIKELQKETV